VITPKVGASTEYDDIVGSIATVERELEEYLEKQKTCARPHMCSCFAISLTPFLLRSVFGTKTISYRNIQKELYQIEVPIKSVPKSLSPEYQVMSQTKARFIRRFVIHLSLSRC
jgi:hypothetical protein